MKFSVLALGLISLGACQIEAPPSKSVSNEPADKRPHIVLVLTDDQGYGDVGILGNPLVNTPNIDALYDKSVRLTNFHVDPTCSPTRAALMTGQHSMRAGVWHTVMGRSMLPTEKITIAEALSDAGYRTGIFGKWHLGDNYPFRPQDQGFDRVVIHGGGGVGQTPDVWGNTQFDDQYFVGDEVTAFAGNSTDVWFDAAEAFLKEDSDKPAFAYVSLNAPHSPWRAPEGYVAPYRDVGLPDAMALFYAMITHLDERVGQLKQVVEGLSDDRPHIFIFMTDNGSSFRFSPAQMSGDPSKVLARLLEGSSNPAWQANGGLRGFKGEVYDGGHRVPFFISGPAIERGRDVDQLSAHMDVLPTLMELAGLSDMELDTDGISLAPFILSRDGHPELDRTIVVTNQRVFMPAITRPIAVLTDRWRYLTFGEQDRVQLFDILADPGQARDVIDKHPDIAARMQAEVESWWAAYDLEDYGASRIIIGKDAPDSVRLTAMDWMEAETTSDVPWFPGFDREPSFADPSGWIDRETDFAPLPWYIDVVEPGRYRIETYFHDRPADKALPAQVAALKINDRTISQTVSRDAKSGVFEVDLKAGHSDITAWFADKEGAKTPAFYVYLSKPDKP